MTTSESFLRDYSIESSPAQTHAEPLVYCVIPNWNLKDDLLECLGSLLGQGYDSLQVVVVDNASTDDSVRAIQSLYPHVHLIQNQVNEGYARAVNQGITWALSRSADFVLLLNNDTWVEPGMLRELIHVSMDNPQAGVIAPKVLHYVQPQRIYSVGDRKYPWSPIPLHVAHNRLDNFKYEGILQVDYVSGCGMMIRADVIRDVGALDESFFMYYEDADLCRRIRDAGYMILTVGKAHLRHKAATSARRIPVKIKRIKARNRVVFYCRHRHGPHPYLTVVYLFLTALLTLSRDALRGDWNLITAYLKGLSEGIDIIRHTQRTK